MAFEKGRFAACSRCTIALRVNQSFDFCFQVRHHYDDLAAGFIPHHACGSGVTHLDGSEYSMMYHVKAISSAFTTTRMQ